MRVKKIRGAMKTLFGIDRRIGRVRHGPSAPPKRAGRPGSKGSLWDVFSNPLDSARPEVGPNSLLSRFQKLRRVDGTRNNGMRSGPVMVREKNADAPGILGGWRAEMRTPVLFGKGGAETVRTNLDWVSRRRWCGFCRRGCRGGCGGRWRGRGRFFRGRRPSGSSRRWSRGGRRG